jgi:hypothetical protein
MKTYGRGEGEGGRPFQTSAIDGGLLPPTGRFTIAKTASCMRAWLGHRPNVDTVHLIKNLSNVSGIERALSFAEPAAYIDCASPAHDRARLQSGGGP